MRRPFLVPILIGVLSLCIAFGPIGLALLSGGIANAAGCIVNEAGANPCVVMGVDIGEMLSTMFVLGWLSLATLPIGLMGLVLAVIWALIVFAGRLQKRRDTLKEGEDAV